VDKNQSQNGDIEKEPNYRALAILGFVFFVGGMTTGNPGLLIIGLACLGVGLAFKDKWGKNKK
jgi:hypothetical protein